MKYALIESNVVKQISYEPIEGYVEVNDDVFADMVKDGDSYDYTDELKAKQQQLIQDESDRQSDRASGKTKLKELGLTDAQIKALTGVE